MSTGDVGTCSLGRSVWFLHHPNSCYCLPHLVTTECNLPNVTHTRKEQSWAKIEDIMLSLFPHFQLFLSPLKMWKGYLVHTQSHSLTFSDRPLTGYTVELGSDNWQLAMFVFTLLTGHFPWEKADITDPAFNYFAEWQKRKTTRTPKEFKRFTPRLLKMFRRMLEIKPSKRYPCKEVYKYLKDRWLNERSPRSSTVTKFFHSANPDVVCMLLSRAKCLQMFTQFMLTGW